MSSYLKKISSFLSNHKGLVLIVTAALLLQLVSAVQFFYTHKMLEAELGKRAESELRMKAIIIKGMLNTMENTLNEHLWDVKHHLNQPDSMFEVTKRIIMNNPEVVGSFLAFTPDYYPEKGRLFEPYAYKDDDGIHVKELVRDEGHDYDKNPSFKKIQQGGKPSWSDPYVFEEDGKEKPLVTYSYPLYDDKGSQATICGIDISLDWLGDTLNANHIYPSSFNLLLTESGELASRPSSGQVDSDDVDYIVRLINDSTVIRSKSESGHSTVIRFEDKHGNNASVYFANMKNKPHWQVAVVCYDKEVYGRLRFMGINMIVLMLLVLGILGIIFRRFLLNERRLSKAREEKGRIDNELRIATAIQNAMLAHEEGLANRPDITVSASLKPAREVGGDLYDYFIRDEKLFFCIGDVAGKGIPSALIMAMTQALFRAVAAKENNPAHIVQAINTSGCRNNKTNIFATLFIGVLDLPTGRLRYCNAGHDIPVVIDGESVTPLPAKSNLPVGLFDDFHFELQETTIAKDATLFLYTDGLSEARNNNHKQFSEKRIMKVLNLSSHDSPKDVIQKMAQEVRQFVGEEEQSDDLTMLAFRYSPITDDYIQHGEVTLKNDVSQLENLHNFLKSVAEKIHMDTSTTRNIRLAVEEAVVNIMDYAYPAGTEGIINVKAMSDTKCLKLVITDFGAAFNPTEAARADTSLSAEDRPIGGLGIFLVRELMDSINYERSEGKNILTLKKKTPFNTSKENHPGN